MNGRGELCFGKAAEGIDSLTGLLRNPCAVVEFRLQFRGFISRHCTLPCRSAIFVTGCFYVQIYQTAETGMLCLT